MTTGAKILLGAGLLAAVLYFRNISKTANLIPSIVGAKIHKITGEYITIKFNVGLQNPNSSAVTVNRVNGYLGYNGRSVATFDWTGPVVVPGDNATKNINGITVKIANVELAAVILAAVKNKTAPTFSVDGYITTNGNKIPFSTSFDASFDLNSLF